jgi:hypothetical protein
LQPHQNPFPRYRCSYRNTELDISSFADSLVPEKNHREIITEWRLQNPIKKRLSLWSELFMRGSRHKR